MEFAVRPTSIAEYHGAGAMLLLDGAESPGYEIQRCVPRHALPLPCAPRPNTYDRVLRSLVIVLEGFACNPTRTELVAAQGVRVAPDMVDSPLFGHLDHHRTADGAHSADAVDTSQVLHAVDSRVEGEDGAVRSERNSGSLL